MIAEQLAADRAVCDAATAGPWANDWGRVRDGGCNTVCTCPHLSDYQSSQWIADKTFITAARTRWPAALDEIDRLRAALAKISVRDGLLYNERLAQAVLDGVSQEQFEAMELERYPARKT